MFAYVLKLIEMIITIEYYNFLSTGDPRGKNPKYVGEPIFQGSSLSELDQYSVS